jgi:uncharacterized protein
MGFRQTKPRGLRGLRFALRCLWNFSASVRWFAYLKNSPDLERTRVSADILQLPHRPYFDYRLRAPQAVSILIDHQRLVAQWFNRSLLERVESGEACPISEIVGKSGDVHTLVLSQQGRFLKEGLLSLSLLDAASTTVMSLSLTFGERQGGKSALIGGLQACAIQATEHLRQSTHQLHGIQPRLLLLHAVRVMCSQLGILNIEAVSTKNHVFRSNRYRFKRTVHLSYEALWEMAGGTQRDDGNYDIPVTAPRKLLTSYPSKKRSEYKRRFDLLDLMKFQICAALSSQPASPGSSPKPPDYRFDGPASRLDLPLRAASCATRLARVRWGVSTASKQLGNSGAIRTFASQMLAKLKARLPAPVPLD